MKTKWNCIEFLISDNFQLICLLAQINELAGKNQMKGKNNNEKKITFEHYCKDI
jgi:hypothetical protein